MKTFFRIILALIVIGVVALAAIIFVPPSLTKPEDKLALSMRNIKGIRVLPSNRVSARDVMNTRRVVLTQAALEKLQDVLG